MLLLYVLLFAKAGAPLTFQPAWAAGANKVLSPITPEPEA